MKIHRSSPATTAAAAWAVLAALSTSGCSGGSSGSPTSDGSPPPKSPITEAPLADTPYFRIPSASLGGPNAPGNTVYAGRGVAWSEGSFVPLSPAVLPGEAEGGESKGLQLRLLTSSGYSKQASEDHTVANLDAAYSFIELSGSLSKDTSTTSSSLGSSLTFEVVQEFEPVLFTIDQLQAPAWTDSALDILAIEDPLERAREFREAYGDGLCIGYQPTKSVRLTLTANLDSYSNSSSTLSKVRAKYSSLAGSAGSSLAFASLLEEALQAEDLQMSLTYRHSGSFDFDLPSDPSELATVEQKRALINDLLATFAGDSDTAEDYAIVIPWQAVNGSPLTGVALPEAALVGEAAYATRFAMAYVERADAWLFPLDVQKLLAPRTHPSGDSFLDVLVAERSELLDLASDVWKRTSDYLGSASEENEEALVTSIANLRAELDISPQNLETVLYDIDAMVTALPDIRVTPTHHQDRSGVDTDHWVRMSFFIENVALVSRDLSDLEQYISSTDAPAEQAPCMVFEDRHHSTGAWSNIPDLFAFGGLRDGDVTLLGPSSDPGAEGLVDLQVSFDSTTNGRACTFRMRFLDQLGRMGVTAWDLDVY